MMAGKRKPKSVQASAIMPVDNGLTIKQRLFIDHYIVCMNGTEAARRAGYDGDNASLAVIASTNLRNVNVTREIDARLNKFTMSANEVLIHLTDIARGDIGDAINAMGGIDVTEAIRRGKSGGIKRFKTKTIIGEEEEIYEAEVEMYDRLDALKTLAKFHSLLVNKVEVVDWRSQAIADIKAGNLSFEMLANAFDTGIATELFAAAGLSIPYTQR